MAIRIVPYAAEHTAEVRAFNQRLRTGGAPADYVFSETHVPAWLPRTPGAPVYNEFYLALDDKTVRGAFVLKHQRFSIRGEVRPVVFYHHPFSEGIVDKDYTQIGLQMLLHVIRAHPILYALGMGGYERPLPRMLIALKWPHALLPFYFRINHPAKFLRNIQTLQQSFAKRVAADLAAFTGFGWAAIHSAQGVSGWKGMHGAARASEVAEFGDWADELWKDCAPAYSMIAVRDCAALRVLYPASNSRFIRLRVTENARPIGWAVVASTQMRNHEQYGDLNVGALVDCFARPEHAAQVIAVATRALIARDVDVITSNQSHEGWVRGLRECGFFKGPSNFIFAAAPNLAKLINPFDTTVASSHFTRGDGDGLLPYC